VLSPVDITITNKGLRASNSYIIKEIELKKCYICEQKKPHTEFHNNKNSKDGFSYACSNCKNLRNYYYGNINSRTHRLQIGQLKFLKYVAFYGEKCPVCGKNMTNIFSGGDYRNKSAITIDRIVPKAKGGKFESSNLWPLCYSCNASKGSKDLDVFLDEKGINLEVQQFDPYLPGDSMEKYWQLLAHQFNNTSKSISNKVAKKFTKHLDIFVPVDDLSDML